MTARSRLALVGASVLAVASFAVLHAQSPAVGSLQAPAEIYRPGPGITNPVVLKEIKPSYTPQAMREGIQGRVVMEAVVREDGTVGDVRVTRSLSADTGLDAEAVKAAKGWRFKPAMKDGQPVPIYVRLELEFRLHATPMFGAGAYAEGTPGLVAPKPIDQPQPRYTPAALAARVEGTVDVEVVVKPDGTVGEQRIPRPLNVTATVSGRQLLVPSDELEGLNAQALATAARWTFEPATLAGKAVPAIVKLTFTFRIH